jgi:hypothetical protein
MIAGRPTRGEQRAEFTGGEVFQGLEASVQFGRRQAPLEVQHAWNLGNLGTGTFPVGFDCEEKREEASPLSNISFAKVPGPS